MRLPPASTTHHARPLHVGSPNPGDRAIFDRLVDQIFQRQWFTNNGELVREFEAMLCDYLGVRHCIPVCNATVGLQLACQALELTGEVIVPAFTFVATPHAVCWERLTPVFADVDATTHTLCPASVESLINERTSAIIGVHVWGNPCDTNSLQQIAARHGIELIYDAAHAFACGHEGQMVGSFGRCEVFSFHATKFFHTFEGGAIATNDDVLAQKIRLMKNFGFAGQDNVIHLGTNAKMTEISAAMGISMFANLQQILEHNRRNYLQYQSVLNQVNGLRMFSLDHLQRTNWQYIVVEVDESQFGQSRDGALEHLRTNGILARRYFYPGCHRMQPYQSMPGDTNSRLENTNRLCERVLCLPTGCAVSADDINRICDVLLRSRRSQAAA